MQKERNELSVDCKEACNGQEVHVNDFNVG
jgi:hypothetical protein